MAGVSCSSDGRTTSLAREHVLARRELAVWHRHDVHARRGGRAQPVRGVLDGDRACRRHPELHERRLIDVGRGLAASDLFARHRHGEEVGEPGEVEHFVDHDTVRRRREPEGPDRREGAHRGDGARQQRQRGPVALAELLDDARRDLLRREGDAEPLVHVARPLGRAHPQHLVGRRGRPDTAFLGDQVAPRLVPRTLGVDEHAVEVEHDRPASVAHGPIVCPGPRAPTRAFTGARSSGGADDRRDPSRRGRVSREQPDQL